MANSEYVAAKKAYDDLMAAYGKADADVASSHSIGRQLRMQLKQKPMPPIQWLKAGPSHK